jgi:2-polyprenyl-3-methyl-5-hydroxy-6-metoxy-1,4-benzoquinol methylase
MAQADQVRAVFEQPKWYLDQSRHNIRIRAETVNEFVRGRRYRRILDIGCGDGSVSLPLLHAHNRLTLLDVSSAMLSAARAQTPPELIRNVDFINDDFLNSSLAGQYDLILCIGILAHVSSPTSVIAKVASLLEPGGYVIAQSTECDHPLTLALRAYERIRSLVIPAPYCVTFLSGKEVLEMFARQGLQVIDLYRYSSPLPGMARILSADLLCRLTRWLHGHHPRSRNAELGNEVLYQFHHTN